MSLHDELHARYVAQPKVAHREYDDFLVEEIGRLRAKLKSAVESKQILVLDNAKLCSENRKISSDLLMIRQQKNELISRLSPEQPKLPEGVSVLPKCALCEQPQPEAIIQRVTGDFHLFEDAMDAQRWMKETEPPPGYFKCMSVQSWTWHSKSS
jgi:hypothetical protein